MLFTVLICEIARLSKRTMWGKNSIQICMCVQCGPVTSVRMSTCDRRSKAEYYATLLHRILPCTFRMRFCKFGKERARNHTKALAQNRLRLCALRTRVIQTERAAVQRTSECHDCHLHYCRCHCRATNTHAIGGSSGAGNDSSAAVAAAAIGGALSTADEQQRNCVAARVVLSSTASCEQCFWTRNLFCVRRRRDFRPTRSVLSIIF